MELQRIDFSGCKLCVLFQQIQDLFRIAECHETLCRMEIQREQETGMKRPDPEGVGDAE